MNGENGSANYGLRGNYDTYMIKSTEWGAFTYLSQSKYWKYGNTDYSGKVTGCSGGQSTPGYSTQCYYTYDSG